MTEPAHKGPKTDVASVIAEVPRPRRALLTGGMPYANAPLHLGHLAGALLPPDIYSRWLGMCIGRQNVLFVCGSDDHGSTSEVAALRAGKPLRQFVDEIHDAQERTLSRYCIGLDVYSGTSQPDCFPIHAARSQDFLRRLHTNGLLEKRVSKLWFDPKTARFLPDRFVRGRCPNPKCENEDAYGDECDVCGNQYEPSELIRPRSAVSDATPELRATTHWYLDMWAVAETLRSWVESRQKVWRANVLAEVLDKLKPALRFDRAHEPLYKEHKAELPPHKPKYAPGQRMVLQLATRAELETTKQALAALGIVSEPVTEWAHRAITRDTSWGIPVPDVEPELLGKTLYVWPDSLIAPISFTELALKKRGEDPARYAEFWRDPDARIMQFLGQDGVFFYVLMQGALWLGSQDDPKQLPVRGELQLSDVFGCFFLLVSGHKMSKSRGNSYTADQLLDEKGYEVDQLRYYLSLLGLPEKPSDFDFAKLDERNKFLAGPMNAALERPISAVHSKFGGKVPDGTLHEKVVADTVRMVQRYVKAMQRAEYPSLLFEIENYARTINSLFTQYKPHDDRHPEPQRRDALFTAFYVLKNLMIMLHPFVPSTMERVRQTLNLPEDVFRIDELGVPIAAGHAIGPQQQYFPAVLPQS
jgi:methionyl-tRNA synthetase